MQHWLPRMRINISILHTKPAMQHWLPRMSNDVQLNISHAVALRIKENHTVRQESCPLLNLGIVIM